MNINEDNKNKKLVLSYRSELITVTKIKPVLTHTHKKKKKITATVMTIKIKTTNIDKFEENFILKYNLK